MQTLSGIIITKDKELPKTVSVSMDYSLEHDLLVLVFGNVKVGIPGEKIEEFIEKIKNEYQSLEFLKLKEILVDEEN
jgi:hypothetical protein